MSERRVSFTSGGLMAVAPGDRRAHDFDPTPPAGTAALCIAEERRLRDFTMIWEPAAGDGQMVDVLRTFGHTVWPTELVERGRHYEHLDFLTASSPRSRAVVTNPPFALCNDETWLEAAWRLDLEYMALLLPLTFFATERGVRMFATRPPQRLRILGFRLDFKGRGAPPGNHHWAIWDRAVGAGCEVDVLPKPVGFPLSPRLTAPRAIVSGGG